VKALIGSKGLAARTNAAEEIPLEGRLNEGERWRLVADRLFVVADHETALLAGRCRRTGQLRFPLPEAGGSEAFEEVRLPSAGKLWTFTAQRFRQKSPFNDGMAHDAQFVPYAVGYVELGDLLIVESRIVAADIGALKIGMPMRLVRERLRRDPDGVEVITYAFSPEGA
jgi:uncharacterized protein